ncbi:hypothetical protein O181_016261 [Austropuccinia psidii MF-1]|uniref:CCHC-type domain-containing protein n=1 Tax=Austropuccinia psidii MF-1 TaxID=1389203 RepID=A0A9Q3GQV8_9BASI|nr:hypothetical protein [Austropuccinia psidii MF-1]
MVNTRSTRANLEPYRDNPDQTKHTPDPLSSSDTIQSSSGDFHSVENISSLPLDTSAMSDERTQDDKDVIIQQLQQQISMLQLNSQPFENPVYKRFMKDSASFSTNTVILGREGLNVEEWKDSLNLSLEMVFPPIKDFCDNVTNFDKLKPMEEISLRNLIIKTIDFEFYCSLLAKNKNAKQLYQLILDRCRKSSRLTALEYVQDIISFVNIDSEEAYQKWIEIFPRLHQLELLPSQIYGLFMQATIATSSSNLGSIFRQNVQQVLGRETTISPFEDVARVIKEEINNVKRTENMRTTSSVLKIQPYFQPGQRQQTTPSHAIYQHPNTSMLPSNPAFVQQYGSKCSYCQKDGHWYIDCTQYEKD